MELASFEVVQLSQPVLGILTSDFTPEWGAVIGASLAAAVCDLRTGRIPNWLSLTVAGVGLIFAAWNEGLMGFGGAALAWVAIAVPFIILFLLGRGGAGDAKMMGAIGAWLGLRDGAVVLGCVCLVGLVLAVLKILASTERWMMFRNLKMSLYLYLVAFAGGREGWRLLKTAPEETPPEHSRHLTIPYGVAIFLGVCLGALVV